LSIKQKLLQLAALLIEARDAGRIVH
jgi:hypothetical protein